MVMERLPIPFSQLAKIASLLFLLLLAPFIPPSLRPSYLYFLFNVLIVALGVEAGFLRAISGARDDKKPTSVVVAQPSEITGVANSTTRFVSSPPLPIIKPVEKEKVSDGVVKKKIKKCPSRASIFFIGSLDTAGSDHREEEEQERVEEEEWKDHAGDQLLSKQELFAKAETFIGNFYKQLKMQREESWKKLHDLYYHHHYKAF